MMVTPQVGLCFLHLYECNFLSVTLLPYGLYQNNNDVLTFFESLSTVIKYYFRCLNTVQQCCVCIHYQCNNFFYQNKKKIVGFCVCVFYMCFMLINVICM